MTPVITTVEEPDRGELARTAAGRIVLASYFVLRVAVGVIGLALPFVLIVGDWLFLAGSPNARGSMSAYYHSGMRDVFVGSLCVTGLFLVTYKVVYRRAAENWWSIGAGIAGIGVALFPTHAGRGQALTPLQERFGENAIAAVHYTCAAVFVVALARMSFLFARSDESRSKHTYARAHRVLGGLMLSSVALLGVAKFAGWDRVAGGVSILLIVEVACTACFGISWLLKGIELRSYLAHEQTQRHAVPAVAGTLGTPSTSA